MGSDDCVQKKVQVKDVNKCVMALTECDKCHDEDLRALSQEHRQQHALPGGSEDITMHLLPPRLFLCILLERNGRINS